MRVCGISVTALKGDNEKRTADSKKKKDKVGIQE